MSRTTRRRAPVFAITPEHERLRADKEGRHNWRGWGPYLGERQWGTVREDYSPDGAAWNYFPHDHARSRAYRWGEDGIAGVSDDKQRLCLSLALWNERDPILKERLFGLTNAEGNHGEDVKELYYYLDAVPTHAYLKMLYKYPQARFPYERLTSENARRGVGDPEFELLDTGVFDDGRYFDVYVEYARATADDVLMLVTAHNRGRDDAPIRLIPQIWLRNTWSWGLDARKPSLRACRDGSIEAVHHELGPRRLYIEGDAELLFTENESNTMRLWGVPNAQPYVKDAFQERIVNGDAAATNPAREGTKACAHRRVIVPGGGCVTMRLRLTPGPAARPFADFDDIFDLRRREADEFYAHVQRGVEDDELRRVQRQAFAGLIWSKQFYYFDVPRWLEGDPGQPAPPAERLRGRNHEWAHLNNADVVSMPDKWEYPWYAAWDLAFHCIPFTLIDPEFAKSQLVLLAREWYMHPNGQLPAYEWSFGDVNPPVHAWAAWRVFQIDRKQRGDAGDLAFLERVFHKLSLNFTWWVNRKDSGGRNIFQGGFLGLDNIGAFDRGAPLPPGWRVDQSDGTSWMAMFSLNMMRIALELALHNPVYEDIATKYFEHFLHIAKAMTRMGEEGVGLWDEKDGFYYDVLHRDGAPPTPMRMRTMVGLIPLFAVETIEPDTLDRLPGFASRLRWFLDYRPDLAELVSRWQEPGVGERRLLSLLRGHRTKRLLARMLDEREFLSEYGVRALSRAHSERPYELRVDDRALAVRYQPGESDSTLFGGNSNWRGPVWMPVNFLIIESLQRLHHYYGDDFKVECPTGSGVMMSLAEAAQEVSRRLTRIFVRDAEGRRPVFGACELLHRDPHFRDHVLFYEYFHGDTGRGVGASHQTGWTALIAKLIQPRTNESPHGDRSHAARAAMSEAHA